MSNSEKITHIATIMQELLKGQISTAIDSKASNRNQYYATIKRNGIELIEVWKPNLTNTGRHKERSLHKTKDNIKRAKEYLKKLLKSESSRSN